MKLPLVNKPLRLVIKGKPYDTTCTDVFDGGFGYYFDTVFSKKAKVQFSVGEQCEVPELGPKCLADFVGYPKQDGQTVRFLLTRWS